MLSLQTAVWTLLFTTPHIRLVVARPEPSPSFDPAHYAKDSIITRDVCVVGGGSSGTYTAIRAKDSKKSVVVIEKKGRLGGHTETYTDPATGLKEEYGVEVWHDLDIVNNYFARFDVPLVKLNFGSPEARFVDFRTGKDVPGFPRDFSEGLTAYVAQLAKYPDLEAGFFLPDPVPPELLLPFGEFVEKYPAIKPAVNFLFNFAQGLGDFLQQPTVYLFKNIGLDVVRNFQAGFFSTERGDNSELYEKAGAELGKDVLLNSTVIATERKAGTYAKLVVKTPSGLKLIQAKKIVITIPPQPRNLRGFDLGKEECSLFERFSNSGYYTGLIRNSGIPSTASIQNVRADTPYNIPKFPGFYTISPTRIPGLLDIKYGSVGDLSDAVVKANIIADVTRLRPAGTDNTTEPEFAVYSSHTPFELTVPAKEIEKGFYRDLYALQGKRHTFYTGAAFHTHDSSLLWNFTEAYVIPGITA
jgi:hypothetical protein